MGSEHLTRGEESPPETAPGVGDLLDSGAASGQWWTGQWDSTADQAEVTIAVHETLYDFSFKPTSATSAWVRFDISEHQGDLSPASSSPVEGWVCWGEGEFALATQDENGLLAGKWDGDNPFGDDELDELTVDKAVAGFARLPAQILLSLEQYNDAETLAKLLGVFGKLARRLEASRTSSASGRRSRRPAPVAQLWHTFPPSDADGRQ